MEKDYNALYTELIGKEFRTTIIRYDTIKKNYEYFTYSHKVGATALDDVVKLVIDDIVFYAFSESEILGLEKNMNLLEDLRDAAQYAYAERLPQRTYSKTDGILGEVLLDIFIQLASPDTKKLIARAKHTEMKSKTEITGYDALYFTLHNSEICLWLGQAKAGEKKYCKTSIIKDLQEKYSKEYFANTAFYIADKNEADELEELLSDINRICFRAQKEKWSKSKKVDEILRVLMDNHVKIKIPCLISYTQDIYDVENELEGKVINEIQEIIDEFDTKSFMIDIGLVYEIVFYVLPVKDINYIRDKIVELKKDTV